MSLAVHLLLVLAWRHGSTLAPPAAPTEPPRSVAVWLRPPPPKPVTAPAPPPRTTPNPAAPRKQAAAPRAISTPPAAITTTSTTEPLPDPLALAAEPPAAPRFDRDAALRMARRMASERDPARADTAVGQFPDRRLQPDSKLERGISAAKRRDCKDGLPGGLLAPIFLLMDKKDHGCKW